MTAQRRYFKILAWFIGTTILCALSLDYIMRPPFRRMTLMDFNEAEGATSPPPATNTTILLVTAMFPLAKAKHSKAEYRIWMDNFLGQMSTDIYMYTTPELASFIQSIRGDLPITIDTSYTSPFQVPPLRDLEETYVKMSDQDVHKSHHSPHLYAVWNAKPYLLDSAVKRLAKEGKNYTYAFWNDGGSFRQKNHYKDWPSAARVDQIWEEGSRLTGSAPEDLLFFPVLQPFSPDFATWTERFGPIDNVVQVSEGSFFGGSPSTIEWFSKVFYAYHNHYLALGLFVGIDQDVFNTLFMLYPQRMFTVWYYDPSAPAHEGITPSPSIVGSLETAFLGECGPEWFYYQFWLADRSERDMMRGAWISQERWRRWGWWQERMPCRLTRAMSMMDFLSVPFGPDWTPPPQTIFVPGLSE